MEIVQMKHKDIKEMRENLHKLQDHTCPVCKNKTPMEDTTLDHQHKLFKDQPLLENGAGMVRGVLCFQCNALEGKIFGAMRRLGMHKKGIDAGDILRNLADYLDRDNLPFIHPNEAPKEPKIKKTCYNKLKKVCTVKMPAYPRSGKLTKELKGLFERFNVEVEYLKG
jgi:hypothetical protein